MSNEQKLLQLRIDTVQGKYGNINDKDFRHIIGEYDIQTKIDCLLHLQNHYWKAIADIGIGKKNHNKDLLAQGKINLKAYHKVYSHVSNTDQPFFTVYDGNRCIGRIQKYDLRQIKHTIIQVGKDHSSQHLAKLKSFLWFENTHVSKQDIDKQIIKAEQQVAKIEHHV